MSIICLMKLTKNQLFQLIDHNQEFCISYHQLLDSLIINKSHLYLIFIKIHVSVLENKSVFLKEKLIS